MNVQNAFDDVEPQPQAAGGAVEGFEVLLEVSGQLFAAVGEDESAAVDEHVGAVVGAVFDGVVEEVFDRQRQEFEVRQDGAILFGDDVQVLSGVFQHQQVDARFDQVADFVGAQIGAEVFGADLLHLGEFVNEEIEPGEDRVEAGFLFGIVDHLREEAPFGDGGFELVHDRPQQKLARLDQVADGLHGAVEGVGHFGDFIVPVAVAVDLQISLREEEDLLFEFTQRANGADDPKIEDHQQREGSGESDEEFDGKTGAVEVFEDELEAVVVDEDVAVEVDVDHVEFLFMVRRFAQPLHLEIFAAGVDDADVLGGEIIFVDFAVFEVVEIEIVDVGALLHLQLLHRTARRTLQQRRKEQQQQQYRDRKDQADFGAQRVQTQTRTGEAHRITEACSRRPAPPGSLWGCRASSGFC